MLPAAEPHTRAEIAERLRTIGIRQSAAARRLLDDADARADDRHLQPEDA
ncbi:hypothetical protein [Methylobacterium nodulans]|uniref:Uncharacterized protein n=1 Tax=Methylobacterium nodulans (strain LMG 21967 / CNCM I-2342 / ORS 2060) TaxID=460265 RepID=B8IRI2_METNO|nr:hypothetical protein [Methylobacterium nodulans]ACL58722.1 hypothetical protein Mnod_3822 [Methylobacterium nodulans ORS 2060]